MTIEITVTTDIQASKSGYAGVKKHTEHDPRVKHSNKDILPNYTKYNAVENSTENSQKLSEWQEDRFGDWLEERNKQQREKGHAERQIDGVKSWLKTKKRYTGVLTLGSMETTNDLMRLLVPASALETRKTEDGQERVYIKLDHPEEAAKFYGMYQRAFKRYLKVLETDKATSEHLMIGRHAMHVDELGAPHLHYEIAYAGKTAKGRPTPAVDAALKSYWKDMHPNTKKVPVSREVWSWYRGVMDSTACHCLADAIEDTYGKAEVIKLVRKSKDDPTIQTGLTMEQYKAVHAERGIVQAQIKADKAAAKKALYDQMSATRQEIRRGNQLHAQNKQLDETLKAKQKQVDALDDQISAKKVTAKELDDTIKAKQAEASELDKTIKRQKEEKKTVETEVEGLKEQKRTADQVLKNAQTHHRTVMAGLKEEEEVTQARHDELLAENGSLEQKNSQLRATKKNLQTAINQQQSVLDQITNQLKVWITSHLKNLMNLSDNFHKGFFWAQQNNGDMNSYEADQEDDIDRLTHEEDVPNRYNFDKTQRQWKRTVYQRKQRNLRERTGATDYSRHDDGPDL